MARKIPLSCLRIVHRYMKLVMHMTNPNEGRISKISSGTAILQLALFAREVLPPATAPLHDVNPLRDD